MFVIDYRAQLAGSIFKNKKTGLLYLRIDESKEYLDRKIYVNLTDRYIYKMLDDDMELWVYAMDGGYKR